MYHKIEQQLDVIMNFISQQQLLKKEIFTMNEAATYSGLSKSYLYKKTASRLIPFYKLEGKLIYFKKSELDQYLLSKRVVPLTELAAVLPLPRNRRK